MSKVYSYGIPVPFYMNRVTTAEYLKLQWLDIQTLNLEKVTLVKQ